MIDSNKMISKKTPLSNAANSVSITNHDWGTPSKFVLSNLNDSKLIFERLKSREKGSTTTIKFKNNPTGIDMTKDAA